MVACTVFGVGSVEKVEAMVTSGNYAAIGKMISGLILFFGYIMAAFTDKKRALHDMIASTLVVRADSVNQIP